MFVAIVCLARIVPISGGEGASHREWLLARVSVPVEARAPMDEMPEQAEHSGALARARMFSVTVLDRLVPAGGRSKRGERLAQNLDGVLRGLRRFGGDAKVELSHEDFPTCGSSLDVALVVLGLTFSRLCEAAGESFPDVGAEDFVDQVRKRLRLAFSFLRAGAGRSGEQNVLLRFSSDVACREFLRLFAREDQPTSVRTRDDDVAKACVRVVGASDMHG